MISILIPIYNFDVRELVANLHRQCHSGDIEFEILCYDDHSKLQFIEINRELKKHSNVVLVELPENIGRAKIRNQLAFESKYEQLLFMDCDSKIPSEDFIENYVKAVEKNTVVVGGRIYESLPPKEEERYFRWYYGVHREQLSAGQRGKHPYRSFMTNNFLIPKSLLQSIQFNENLTGYGHEDTQFGLELKKKGINIRHIENPLMHIQLETTSEFIQKSENGLKNLSYLLNNFDAKMLSQDIRLLKYHNLIKKVGISGIVVWLYTKLKGTITTNLNSMHPRLYLFDLYKLGYLLKNGQKSEV